MFVLLVASFTAIAPASNALSAQAPILQIADSEGVYGGKGGRGGDAPMMNHYTCVQPGSCVFQQGTVAGGGGSGGSALGSKSTPTPSAAASRSKPAPAVAMDEGSTSIISKCLLEIGGKSVIDGRRCAYSYTAGDISTAAFGGPALNKPFPYKVIWSTSHDGTATASLTGGSTLGVRQLGLLVQDASNKACWIKSDASVRICAWK